MFRTQVQTGNKLNYIGVNVINLMHDNQCKQKNKKIDIIELLQIR